MWSVPIHRGRTESLSRTYGLPWLHTTVHGTVGGDGSSSSSSTGPPGEAAEAGEDTEGLSAEGAGSIDGGQSAHDVEDRAAAGISGSLRDAVDVASVVDEASVPLS